MKDVKINAIYQHYKGNFYRVINIAHDCEHPEDKNYDIVIYYRCDENGLFISIREREIYIVNQPFYRNYHEFIGNVQGGYPNNPAIKRFKFFKQLTT